MDTRNTKQKKLIVETLKKDKSHPTIQELYQKILSLDNSVGQATVYRNVNRLVDEGKIKRIATTNDVDHYDADCNPHYHLMCDKCAKMIDLYDENYNKLVKNMEGEYLVKITDATVVFAGICDKCI